LYYKKFFMGGHYSNLGPVSPTVAGTSGGGIEMKTLFFVEGQQPQGTADEEGGGGEDGSAL
jgi:hypothetical protein